MGLEYSLYARDSKEYLNLGKRKGDRFQIPSERIIGFLADRVGEEFVICDDSGDLPEDFDPTWRCVGDWSDD